MAKKKETTGKLSRRFRPFKKARDFVRGLDLKNGTEWTLYCKGDLPGKPSKPDDIPACPLGIYKDHGWKGMGDWLGTGTIAYHVRTYRPFRKARNFVHRLELKSGAEWRRYCKGELPKKPPKPDDVPASPQGTYQDQGWQGYGDWLGTGTIAPFLRKFRPYNKAREFAHALELKNKREWLQYCRGELPDKPPRPDDIPAAPNEAYEDRGWKGYGDWLGTGRISAHFRKFRPFKKARDFARALDLKDYVEWRQYCKEGLLGKPPKPFDIPSTPHEIYKQQGWCGLVDWLGTRTEDGFLRKYRRFKQAREFVQALELKDRDEWLQYCGGELPGQLPKPDDIPTKPSHAYKDEGWKSLGDWLGTGRFHQINLRPFRKARAFVRSLKLQSVAEWKRYCKGEMPDKRPKPVDIPASPQPVYQHQGWAGMGDWLGTGTIAPQLRTYRPFKEARDSVHTLKLKTLAEWKQYCKGELTDKPRKTDDIPSRPQRVYQDKGWKGIRDWLGTGSIAHRRAFQKARVFVHALELKSLGEWMQYCQGTLPGQRPKPDDIPAFPMKIYKDKGWKGYVDWLGIDKKRRTKARPFKEARHFALALGLKNSTEWKRYCKGELPGQQPKPDDIPNDPRQAYQAKGWQGYGDWLGTGATATFLRKYRSYKKARAFVRTLELKNLAEWAQYCKGELPDQQPKPDNIPATPQMVYKDTGWTGVGDWLGTARCSRTNLRPFKKARAFVRSLKLKNLAEWTQYCQGKLPDQRPKPDDIPATPQRVYKDTGWTGAGDWLGNGTIPPFAGKRRPFKKARAFVRSLKLKNLAEWTEYCQGTLPGQRPKPDDIPACPRIIYKDRGWKGSVDWLGTGKSSRKRPHPFEEARRFARSLELQNGAEWREYCKGNLPEKPRKPDGVPTYPGIAYKDQGWKGLGDWLGIDKIVRKRFRSFKVARRFVHRLGLKDVAEWERYCNGNLPGRRTKPDNIPAFPRGIYQDDGWKGMDDWLGTDDDSRKNLRPLKEARQSARRLGLKNQAPVRPPKSVDIAANSSRIQPGQGRKGLGISPGTGSTANGVRKYRPFKKARDFVHALELKGLGEWTEYCQGTLAGQRPRPDDIPAFPRGIYKDQGWTGYDDWLGTARPFEEARDFVHALELETQAEWTRYCKGELPDKRPKPCDIPVRPNRTYQGKGWKGWRDWLRTGTIAYQLRKYGPEDRRERRRAHRPFWGARAFVHTLELKSGSEWRRYCTGDLPDQEPKPDDIPSASHMVYKGKGWTSWGDWLGTGTIASSLRKYRPFKKARALVHTLELKNEAEWRQYRKGELPDKPPKPDDIPACPIRVYKNKGWKGIGDWLGTGNIAPRLRKFRPLKKARGFVHALKLKNQLEWQAYCRGELPDKPPKPDDIPSVPNQVYEDKGWMGLSDWLGTDKFSRYKIRPFKKARDFVRALELKSGDQWRRYYKGELPNKPPKPVDIPAAASRIYKNQGWQGMGDWLGTGTIAPHLRKYRSFKKARDFVHALGLKNQDEWRQYCQGELPDKPPKPDDIPTSPEAVYKHKGWKRTGDWLGTGMIATGRRKYRPIKKARDFVRALELKSDAEWKRYCKGELPDKPPRPDDIPACPDRTYRGKGWQGLGDWLGTGAIAHRLRKYRAFKKARNFVRALELKNHTEWKQYCKGELPDKPPKPDDVPTAADRVYKHRGWQGWGDWQGTGAIAPFLGKYRPFKKARAFVRTLKLKNQAEWKQYCKGELPDKRPKPVDIPNNPNRTYQDKGWKGVGDWLGTRAISSRLRKYLPFKKARKFVRALELKNGAEWREYCKGNLPDKPSKPNDIPREPNEIYKDKGWKGLGDWIGTATVATYPRDYRRFRKARDFVHTLGLKSQAEWTRYCKGEFPDKPPKPDDIPASPETVYKHKGWKRAGDWLGTGTIATQQRRYLTFKKARALVHTLELKNRVEWMQYSEGTLPGKPPKPDDLPKAPEMVYKDKGWKGWGDWLGTGRTATFRRKYRPFKKAREFVHTLALKNNNEWTRYAKGELPGKPPKPYDVPASPHVVYKDKGWKGRGDWLGTGAISSRLRKYRPFKKARAFAHRLELKNHAEWKQYCKGEFPDKPPRPDDIPISPLYVYQDKGWKGVVDWLGKS